MLRGQRIVGSGRRRHGARWPRVMITLLAMLRRWGMMWHRGQWINHVGIARSLDVTVSRDELLAELLNRVETFV